MARSLIESLTFNDENPSSKLVNTIKKSIPADVSEELKTVAKNGSPDLTLPYLLNVFVVDVLGNDCDDFDSASEIAVNAFKNMNKTDAEPFVDLWFKYEDDLYNKNKWGKNRFFKTFNDTVGRTVFNYEGSDVQHGEEKQEDKMSEQSQNITVGDADKNDGKPTAETSDKPTAEHDINQSTFDIDAYAANICNKLGIQHKLTDDAKKWINESTTDKQKENRTQKAVNIEILTGCPLNVNNPLFGYIKNTFLKAIPAEVIQKCNGKISKESIADKSIDSCVSQEEMNSTLVKCITEHGEHDKNNDNEQMIEQTIPDSEDKNDVPDKEEKKPIKVSKRNPKKILDQKDGTEGKRQNITAVNDEKIEVHNAAEHSDKHDEAQKAEATPTVLTATPAAETDDPDSEVATAAEADPPFQYPSVIKPTVISNTEAQPSVDTIQSEHNADASINQQPTVHNSDVETPPSGDDIQEPENDDVRSQYPTVYRLINQYSLTNQQAENASARADEILEHPGLNPEDYYNLTNYNTNTLPVIYRLIDIASPTLGHRTTSTGSGNRVTNFTRNNTRQSTSGSTVNVSLVYPEGVRVGFDQSIWDKPVITEFGYPFINLSNDAIYNLLHAKDKTAEKREYANLKAALREAQLGTKHVHGAIWDAIYKSPLKLLKSFAEDKGLKTHPNMLKVDSNEYLNSSIDDSVNVTPIKYYSTTPEYEGQVTLTKAFISNFYTFVDYRKADIDLYLRYGDGMTRDEFNEYAMNNRGIPPYFILYMPRSLANSFRKSEFKTTSGFGTLLHSLLGTRDQNVMVKTTFKGHKGGFIIPSSEADKLFSNVE